MATTEHVGLMMTKDASGNKKILYPVTTPEAIEGVEQLVGKSIAATLSASGWSGNKQTVSVAGMTAFAEADVGLAMSANAEQVTAAAGAMLLATAQAQNSITITAFGTAPTVDIPIMVRVRGVNA